MIYSNKNLELINLEIPATNPASISGQWYWLLNLEFAAWSLRALRRAILASDAPPALCAAFDEIVLLCRSQGHEWLAIVARAAQPVKLPEPDPFADAIGRDWPTYSEHCHPSVDAPGSTPARDLGSIDQNHAPAMSLPKSTPPQKPASPAPDVVPRPARSPKIHRTDPKGLFV